MKGLLKLAKSDFKYAKFAYSQLGQTSDCADLNICAYHTQQCTEKILKYLLESNGHTYDRTHDISILVDLCLNHHIDIPEIIEQASFAITSWATQSRYNSEFKASIRTIAKVLDCCEHWLKELDPLPVQLPQIDL
ncbi:MAG: HEPN domain-containing protein [Cellulosilyticaceae bacterium]